ncbi:hypothetical protein VV869_16460 [Photobacterium sp. MCCC 1A19761]|uniref:hypothetical protein n=1 Tax=Photobacterium sp. MCCC 1A19761 TaxID=3115000 RepID=UPI00307D65EC
MDSHSFDALLGSLDSLTEHQLDRLRSEISSCRRVTHDQVLSDEELLMFCEMFDANEH